MAIRIPWDQYEVALLFSAYERIEKGSSIDEEASKLSEILRKLAQQRQIPIDDTYRNINGIKMQLGNVQYLFSDGEKGLSGASALIREMFLIYKNDRAHFQKVLLEATRLTGKQMELEEAFFEYAKNKAGYSKETVIRSLQKAAEYCHLTQPLLGLTDVKKAREIQQKVAEGKLLFFRFGKETQTIRIITRLYYSFIREHQEHQQETTITQAKTGSYDSNAERGTEDTIKCDDDKELACSETEKHDDNSSKGVPTGNDSIRKEKDEESNKEITPADDALKEKESDNTIHQAQSGVHTDEYGKNRRNTSDFRSRLDDVFINYLLSVKGFAQRTAIQYSQCVAAVEQFIVDKGLDCSLDTDNAEEARKAYETLKQHKDFIERNERRHNQYSAAVAQYLDFIESDGRIENVDKNVNRRLTVKDAVVEVLREAKNPLSLSEIMHRIQDRHLYVFTSSNPEMILYQGIRRFCKGMDFPNRAPVDIFDRTTDASGKILYSLITNEPVTSVNEHDIETPTADERWLFILQGSFPDGYILNDVLGQFQAAAFWQERYGEDCPIQGDDIDTAMKAVGVVRDGRVYVKNEEDRQLISAICVEINTILSRYSTVYRSSIYDRYHEQLAAISIYTEPVMTQQLLAEAKGNFYSYYQFFVRKGQEASVIQDARKVLRDHGGPMSVDEVAKELWFIPRDMVYHYLSVDDESLNIGNSTWMLAEHFPVTRDDARSIKDLLDEYFLTNNYIQAFDLIPLLRSRLPSVAENLSGMTYQAVFNIVGFYLRDQFNFTKAIISPKNTCIDFTDLFRSFAAERDTFTLADLEAFAGDLKLPIYWESTYAGGAVRISKTEFANRRLIKFDVDSVDAVLADFCPGDYLSLKFVSSGMMMHLPSCGYQWNGYLLQSFVYGYSKVFRLSYSSFGKTGYYGAIVRRSCKAINSYAALIERVLTDDDTWTSPTEALDVLVRDGYQAVRKYKGIDMIVTRAIQNRLSDDRR